MQRALRNHRFLLFATLVVSLCVGGWWRAEARPLTPPSSTCDATAAQTTTVRTLIVASARHDDADGGALQHGDGPGLRAWLNDAHGQRNPLGVTDVASWASSQLRVTLDETSNTDNSDQSDGAAHVEPRAGPIAFEPSRALFAVVEAAPRTRSHSSSTPRAPPLSLRFA